MFERDCDSGSSLEADRLHLTAMSIEQLCGCTEDPCHLERQEGIRCAPEIFTAPVLRACAIKIEKMRTIPGTLHPWYTYWLIVTKLDPLVIGCAGFKGVPDEQGGVEIGYGIAPSARGKGFGTEAVQTLVAWAFENSMCLAVWGDSLKSNEPSNRLLKACGARLIKGTETSNVWRIERPV